jgi:hypothetical protein
MPRTHGVIPVCRRVEHRHGRCSCTVPRILWLLERSLADFAHTQSVGIPMTKKKFAELELSLLHLQQNVEIPETHLIIHPIIQKSVEHVRHRVPALR